jgi:hypothetical protein
MEEQKNPADIQGSSEVYRTIRAQVEHYENAINQRVIWLSIGQSFFFNVYAMLVTGKAPTKPLMDKQVMLGTVFPFAALLIAIFTFFDVIATMIYLSRLKNRYESVAGGENTDSVYPPIYGRFRDRLFQHISPVLIPFVFILVWLYLILFDHQLLHVLIVK